MKKLNKEVAELSISEGDFMFVSAAFVAFFLASIMFTLFTRNDTNTESNFIIIFVLFLLTIISLISCICLFIKNYKDYSHIVSVYSKYKMLHLFENDDFSINTTTFD